MTIQDWCILNLVYRLTSAYIYIYITVTWPYYTEGFNSPYWTDGFIRSSLTATCILDLTEPKSASLGLVLLALYVPLLGLAWLNWTAGSPYLAIPECCKTLQDYCLAVSLFLYRYFWKWYFRFYVYWRSSRDATDKFIIKY